MILFWYLLGKFRGNSRPCPRLSSGRTIQCPSWDRQWSFASLCDGIQCLGQYPKIRLNCPFSRGKIGSFIIARSGLPGSQGSQSHLQGSENPAISYGVENSQESYPRYGQSRKQCYKTDGEQPPDHDRPRCGTDL